MPGQDENLGTVWLCVCCLLKHANDECGCEDNDENAHTLSRNAKGRYDGGTVNGDGIPLSRITSGYYVAMGMSRDEHECHSEDCASLCTDCDHDHGCDCEGDDECECECNNSSHSQCEGCGSHLYGQRHAMTLFKSPRPRRAKVPAITTLTTEPAPTVDELIALIDSPGPWAPAPPVPVVVLTDPDDCYCGKAHDVTDKCKGCKWPAVHCLCCAHCGKPFGH